MFEDDLEDIDFDEILNCSQSPNLKRHNSETVIVEPNKKAKNSFLEFVPCSKKLSTTLNQDSLSNNTCLLPGFAKAGNKLMKTFHFKKPITTPATSSNNQKRIESSVADLHHEKIMSSSLNSNFQRTNSELAKLIQVTNENFATSSDKSLFEINNSSKTNITKRRFPGPAGLLPERCSENFKIEELDKTTSSKRKEDICSQSSSPILSEGPWQKMHEEFLPKSPEEIYLPEKYNIQWIKSRVMMRKLINQKTPFLAAFVHSISSHSIQNPIVNIILKDRTGTIQGTILHNLYEEYSNELVVGSVIVLKELGVLNTGSKSEPYLTITSNNLVSIYTVIRKSEGVRDTSTEKHTKIIVQNISATEICSTINELRRLHKIEIENLKNVQKRPLLIDKNLKPLNFGDNFKKAIYNANNKQSIPLQPNLNNLRTNPRLNINSNNTRHKNTEDRLNKNTQIKIPGMVSGDTESINDIIDLLNTQEGINEFFNEEPNFCSTQMSHNNEDRHSSTENCDANIETKCNLPVVNISKDTDKVLEEMLEGLDTDMLFDDF